MEFIVELEYKGTWFKGFYEKKSLIEGTFEDLMLQLSGKLLDIYKTAISDTIEKHKKTIPSPVPSPPQPVHFPPLPSPSQPQRYSRVEPEEESDTEFFDADNDESVLLEDLQKELEAVQRLAENTNSHLLALEHVVLRLQTQQGQREGVKSFQEHVQRFDQRVQTLQQMEKLSSPPSKTPRKVEKGEEREGFNWIEGTLMAGLVVWPIALLFVMGRK